MMVAPGGRSILLVEDDPGISLLIARILRRRSVEVTCAASGREAAEALQRHFPSALFIDLNLPDFSGADFIRTILPRFPPLPFVILTGEVNDSSTRLAFELGARGLIFKNHDFVDEVEDFVRGFFEA
jgi:CheY-like chemotaxis protein